MKFLIVLASQLLNISNVRARNSDAFYSRAEKKNDPEFNEGESQIAEGSDSANQGLSEYNSEEEGESSAGP